jgi:hypothetical protein
VEERHRRSSGVPHYVLEASMSFRYYDTITGRYRIKPRYLFAAAGFCLGLITAFVLTHLS